MKVTQKGDHVNQPAPYTVICLRVTHHCELALKRTKTYDVTGAGGQESSRLRDSQEAATSVVGAASVTAGFDHEGTHVQARSSGRWQA